MIEETQSAPRPAAQAVTPSALLTRVLLACLAVAMLVQAAKFCGLMSFEARTILVDFDAFHVVGRMIWLGRLNEAYDFASMVAMQRELRGADSFMPWTYPPTFDLVLAPLGLLPLWLAYLVFTGTTLCGYVYVLRRLAGAAYGAVLLAFFPALVVGTACGQNGFLTATLIGLACIGLLKGSPAAGVPLGLMAIKPHLAVCLAVYTLATRRWATVFCAAAIVALFCAAATLAFGVSVWTAVLHSVGEAGAFLRQGAYPMYRMVSAYAFLFTIGLPANAAAAGQWAVVALVAALIGTAIARNMPPRQVLALCALASPLLSPYAYDYDLPICSVGVALVLSDLTALTSLRERIVLVALSWTACGWGLAQHTVGGMLYGPDGPPEDSFSGAGLVLVIILVLVWRMLQRGLSAPTVGAGRSVPA